VPYVPGRVDDGVGIARARARSADVARIVAVNPQEATAESKGRRDVACDAPKGGSPAIGHGGVTRSEVNADSPYVATMRSGRVM
jgi:hypothetical protein